MSQSTLAIIGTGAAGMACGHFLHNRYDLTLYEENNYIGGHANTAKIEANEETVFTDTAFIIFNDENYPLFSRMLGELNVDSIRCPMGFSFTIKPTGWEYNTKGLSWFPTNLVNLFDRRFRAMLRDSGRFYREAMEIVREPKYHRYSIADYLSEKGYSDDFINFYLIPIIAVVWSIPPKDMLGYPALTMIEFLQNHGAFQGILGRKQWKTVKGGSRSYRDKIVEPFKDKILLECAATQIIRDTGQVKITDSQGKTRTFDHVILACHADQALKILDDPTALEKDVLGSFRYSKNKVALHNDNSLMPKKRHMWDGWNYLVEKDKEQNLVSSFSYYMNKLQKVSEKTDYFVTVNDTGRINPAKILNEYNYEHPIFDLPAINAQNKIPQLNENGITYFCGSYSGYGFHEDAFRSGIEVCRKLTGENIWGD